MERITEAIRDELRSFPDEEKTPDFQRFFKEEVKCYGLKTAPVTKLGRRYWAKIEDLEKDEIFALCEDLFSSGYTEEAFIAANWAEKLSGRFDEEDIETFRKWIDLYIDNWAKCDTLCNHAVGDYIMKFPDRIFDLKEWAKSKNRWLRRAAAVSLIVPAKKGKFLDDIFEISDILFEDGDDMVQKGYGWLLKDASITRMNDVFEYVIKNKKRMPRTALRYAIERMPGEMRAEAMKKDW
ncbi:MAG: DNA alkylation repair protein [Methanomicrobiaceae archaeon]|nr:DNA alkylation repair protein [Methanomicrobiaceae archaeon]